MARAFAIFLLVIGGIAGLAAYATTWDGGFWSNFFDVVLGILFWCFWIACACAVGYFAGVAIFGDWASWWA